MKEEGCAADWMYALRCTEALILSMTVSGGGAFAEVLKVKSGDEADNPWWPVFL